MADVHIRLDEELLRRFKARCAAKGYSMSQIIRALMAQAINEGLVGRGLLAENDAPPPGH